MRLILASASPRRAELLTAAGYTFEVVEADVDESIRAEESAFDYVQRLASEKSKVGLERVITGLGREGREGQEGQEGQEGREGLERPDRRELDDIVVIGADTAVVVNEEILGKPRDDDDAERMLRQLAGQSHVVLTGVSVRSYHDAVDAVDATEVVMASLSADQVDWYVRSGEGRDKAGAYAIQGLASRFIDRIDGSYSNVVGLPVATVYRLIRTLRARSGVLASDV